MEHLEYLDFDLEITHEAGRDYLIKTHSPAGEAEGRLRFPYDDVALENHLLKLQNALLRSGGPTRRSLSAEEQAVQIFGRALFDALMDGDVGRRYAVCRARADQEDKGLRLRLHIQSPDLAALPWEYLFDYGQSEFLGLLRYTPIVRYLNLPHSRETLAVAPPLRILGMVASPSSPALKPLDVEVEQQRMERALAPLTARKLVELVWLEGHTWRDLQQALWPGCGPWHIFHFIGHGGFNDQTEEGLIALENDEGGLHLLSATHLGHVLRDHRSLRLVLLNACEGARAGKRDIFSSVGATLARAGIPAVLAMQHEITDHAALELTRTFYEALAASMPVDAALTEARIAINIGINNSLEWGTPVLFMRASDSTLFHLDGALPPPAVHQPDPPPAAPPATRQALPIKETPPQKTAEQWVEEGDAHQEAERYEEALAAYEQAIKLDPKNANLHYKKADLLDDLNRSEEALAAMEKALKLGLKEARAYLIKGIVLGKLQRPQEALAAYEHALQLDPNDIGAWNGKGAALGALERYEEALPAYDCALQLDPNYVFAWYGKGNTLRDLQRYQEALAAYERALELDPNYVFAWYGKGNALRDLQRYQEALAAYERALQLDPNYVFAWNGKGNALRDFQRPQEALAAYEQAIQLDPNYTFAWNGKGNALGDLQRSQEALAAYERALQLDPNYADAWNGKGAALWRLQRHEEAIAAYNRAIELNPTYAIAYNNKGISLEALGHKREAEQAYKKARKLGWQEG